MVTHLFACTRRGYVGWRWSVTVTRASRHKAVTVDEVVLIPGDEAIVAPAWVPYRERLQPGDLSPGDLLPVSDEDPRLVPTYSFGDDPLDTDDKAQIREVAQDLGLGRVRTLSVEGRELPPSAGTTATAAPTRRWPSPRRTTAAAAASWSASPVRSPTPSGSAPTATPTTTAGWSAPTTAAVRTPRCGSPRSTSPSRSRTTSSTRSTSMKWNGSRTRPVQPGAGRFLRGALGANVPPPAAVLQPEQPEPEAGQAGPQPPGVPVVLEPGVERQQCNEADQPEPGCRPRSCGRRPRRGARRPRR